MSREDRAMDGVLPVSRVIPNEFSLRPLMCLKCIRAVLFLFKILNGNRIMYGRRGKKGKHTDLQSVPPTSSVFIARSAL